MPGDECLICRDYRIEGEVAFEKGESIRIVAVDPDRLRPGLKYVVSCKRLGKRVRLPGNVIERLDCKQCGERLKPGETRCSGCGWIVPEKESEVIEEELQELRGKLFNARRRGQPLV